jgi:hypothetical protein
VKAHRSAFFLLSLFSPLMAIIQSRRQSYSIKLFAGTLFFGFVGSCFIYNPGNDGSRHMMNVTKIYYDMSLGDFFIHTYNILTFSPTIIVTDLYVHTLSFIASTLYFPEAIHIMGGLVLGYFFTKSFLLITKSQNIATYRNLLFLFIALFLTFRSISALNSLRFWTALWIFFYGYYGYISTKKTKYFYYIGFSMLVHVAYVVYIIPFLGSIFLNKSKFVILSIYALSFLFTIGFSTVANYIPQNEVFEKKQSIYVKEDMSEDGGGDPKDSKMNFYKAYGPHIYMKYSLVFLIIVLVVSGFYLQNQNTTINNLLGFGILLLSIANLMTFVPELVGRTRQVASIFLVGACIVILSNNLQCILARGRQKILQAGLYVFLATAVPVWLFHFSYILNTISVFILALPFVSWFIGNDDISIARFIKLVTGMI